MTNIIVLDVTLILSNTRDKHFKVLGSIYQSELGIVPGAALPHFGRYGKGGDTCFFYPFDKFFGHFFLFFAPMSPDFAHCVTCF